MDKFTAFESHVVPLPAENVDTDQIIPARFLKVTDKNGLGDALFFDWRYLEDGSPNPKFVLNEPASQGAKILIAGDNFGCGSSREHAPWALTGWGLRAILSTSFADIFKNNALKNGLLPIELEPAVHAKLMRDVQADRAAKVKVDLADQSVTLPDGSKVTFQVDPFAKRCLLEGVDQLGYLLGFDEQIKAFEARHDAL
ncbi:MAG: 3-isopropylmalate dehydratase small subunit [Myxococcales bacterium]|nr:3-isopropylmalate dehydratase small subunit [Myxococcales bacterium]